MSEPRMPNGAPRVLRDFVACRSSEVELDLADLGWIPRPEVVPDFMEPSVRIGDGATSTRADLTVGYGDYMRVELPTSIVDGQLHIEVTNDGLGIGPAITKWVDSFNDTLAANDKELEGISVDGEKITITKRAATAASDSSVTAPTAGTAATTTATDAPAAEPEPESEEKPKSGCLAWVMGVGAAIAAAIGIGVWATSGDDNDAEDSVVITADETTTTSSTTTTTSSPPPTTTIAQVGQADTSDGVDDTGETSVASDLPRCGEPGGGLRLARWGDLEVPDGACDLEDDVFGSDVGCLAGVPCFVLDDEYLVAAGTPGINHQTQTVDIVTLIPGNSTYEEWLLWLAGLETSPAEVEVSAVCEGDVMTGGGTIEPGVPTEIPAPLQRYGDCIGRTIVLTVDEQGFVFPQAQGFTVADPEPPAMPATDVYALQIDEVNGGPRAGAFFGDVNTLHNTIGGTPTVSDDCLWVFEPGNVDQVLRVLDACSAPGHFWVFAAGTTDVELEFTITDTVIGTTAAAARPFSDGFAPVDDTTAFGTSGPLFDNSVFPCGNGHVAHTVCPDGAPPMDAGGFITVAAAMGDSIPLTGDGAARAHHVDFASTGGSRYSIVQSPDGWTVSSSAGDTRARALIRGNALLLVVPDDELPEGAASYQWSTEIDGATVTQPVVPVVGVVTTPEIPAAGDPDEPDQAGDAEEPVEPEEPAAPADPAPPPPPEPPQANESLTDFYAQLSASVAAGDAGFSLDRLDPRVFEVYPDSCPAALASFADPDLVIEFLDEGPFEPWTYEADGRSIEIPDALTVTIRLTGRGQSGEPSESHLTIIDGQYRWFTFC